MNTEWITQRLASMSVTVDAALQEAVVAEGGSSVDRMAFMLRGNHVFVWGDRGCAVYRLSERAMFQRIAGYNIGYFVSKCRTMEDTERGYKWCGRAAFEWLSEWASRAAADHAKETDSLASPQGLYEWFDAYGKDFATRLPDDGVGDVGDVIDHQAYWHHEGIKRIAQHLAQQAAAGGAA